MLADRIKQGEGLRLKMYKDSVGKWTIGYGWNIEDNGIPEVVADMLLEIGISKATRDLQFFFPWTSALTMDRQGVLIEMIYNMGVPRFSGFRQMLAALKAGDYNKAADEMLNSHWHEQVGKRAERLAEVMRNGKEL